jgi:hypothetical protein
MKEDEGRTCSMHGRGEMRTELQQEKRWDETCMGGRIKMWYEGMDRIDVDCVNTVMTLSIQGEKFTDQLSDC